VTSLQWKSITGACTTCWYWSLYFNVSHL